MARTIILWALVLAAGAFALQWLQYQHLVRALPTETYVAVIGVAFAAGVTLSRVFDRLRRHSKREGGGR